MRAGSVLLLLLWGTRVVSAWEHVSSGELKRVVEIGKPVLVAFVKPEEPASAALEEEWLSAAASINNNSQQQQLLSIDCSLPDSDCAAQQHIKPYPSILLLQLNKPVATYRGLRRGDSFLNFFARRTRTPFVVEGLDTAALAAFKGADEMVFVAYLDLDTDRELAGVFEDVARGYRDEFSFGMVGDAEVTRKMGVSTPAVVCYRLGEVDGVKLEGRFGVGGLGRWVEAVSRDAIEESTVLNWGRNMEDGWPIVYVFGSTASERQKLRKNLYTLAQSHDSFTWVVVDPFQFPNWMDRLGRDIFPAVAAYRPSGDRVYSYPKRQAFTSDLVEQWLLEVQEDHIKHWTPPVKGESTSHDEL
ncbi:hypothetical protein C8A05DRAFT_36908 [Staphylotrichum tortipilum]|uniref:Thioredoxin domain-containing protein n=1 Tax=Staphylotrichum tortipilum TaxID=2831512 RepID=A0AAN6MG43_9PEZI|nr:hypothetical protein C8A05DRAFT_36908 [Staphylotrichum longicolle]